MARLTRILAWALFALLIAFWAAAAYYDRFSDEVTVTSDEAWAFSFFAFPLVGLFLAVRIPTNAVGWLFLGGPLMVGAGVATTEYAEGINSTAVQWFGDSLFVLGLLCLFAAIVLFPDGRYPSRWFRWAHVSLLAGLAVSSLLGASDLTDMFLLANVGLPVVALIFRAVRGDAVTRRQIAGPVFVVFAGLLVLVMTLFIPEVLNLGSWSGVAAWVVITVGVPISIALAITRYRLYEIDRIVSRTVSYALVVGVLALVFASGVVWIPSVLGLDDTPLAVAGSTLVVAGLFNPLRRRVQHGVDRRFNRSRYHAEQVISEFGAALRDRVDPDGVVDGWVEVVAETMEPSSVAVWVRPRE